MSTMTYSIVNPLADNNTAAGALSITSRSGQADRYHSPLGDAVSADEIQRLRRFRRDGFPERLNRS